MKKKLTLDEIKKKAEVVASKDLLKTISGGTENACHDSGGGTRVFFESVKDRLDPHRPRY
ncbi:MAG: hypothetical protein Q4G08_01055 [Capnocytophaga sp.]|nr:hypothetical protein [Capnocytophaga sp.]